MVDKAERAAYMREYKSKNRAKINADKQAARRRAAAKQGKSYRTRAEMRAQVARNLIIKAKGRLCRAWVKADNYMGMGYSNWYHHTFVKPDAKAMLDMRFRKALRKALNGSESRILPLYLGYTAGDLRLHIKSFITPNMTWADICSSRVHIDHITPRSAFTYTNPEDEAFKQCWALGNLQPLWAEDNRAKGG